MLVPRSKLLPPLHEQRSPAPPRSVLWTILPVAFGIRLLFDAMRQLVPDEAFYWVLSRHLAAGYLDHPPGIAFQIRAGTYLFGFNELGVRCGASLLAFGALLVLLHLCRRTIAGERGAVLLGIMWVCSPLFSALATLATPDTPSIFFSLCALACALAIARQDDPETSATGSSSAPSSILHPPSSPLSLWLCFGLLTGLAMLSKYTAVLPALAVAGALLTTPRGRRELARPGVWLALLVALAVFSPVVYWNATHGWASFKFQLHHGLDADSGGGAPPSPSPAARLASLGTYLVGQLGLYTPIFFVFGIVILVIRWRHYRSLSLDERLLVWSATVPLLFFAFAAFKAGSSGEANWPAFAYFPLSLLTIVHVARLWKPFDVKWLKIGAGLALAITVFLHSPPLIQRVGLRGDRFPRKINEFFGWSDMAKSVAGNVYPGELIVCGRHQDAAELSFYLPGQPHVWCYNALGPDGKPDSRPTAFDYFPDRPDLSKVPALIYFNGHLDDFCRTYGFVTTGVVYHYRGFPNGLERSRTYWPCVNAKK
jgi:4-amino-4-deoxy-L-arabinose transferase-like glycosyltransferase